MSPVSEKRKQSMLKYARENLKRIPLDLPKDEYERIQAHIKEHGYKSLNGWIKSAIATQIELDNSPAPAAPRFTSDEWRSITMAWFIATSAHGYNSPATLDSINEKLRTFIEAEAAPAGGPVPTQE